MRTSARKVKTLCCLSIALLGLFLVCAVVFLAPKATRLFIRAIAPPSDLFTPLVDEPCDVGHRGVAGRFTFENRYSGKHAVGLILAGPAGDQLLKPMSERRVLQLRMEITFFIKNTVILSRIVGKTYSPFSGTDGNGVTFFYYTCPEELPLNETIVCEVRIIEPDDALAKSCNPVRFYICKTSDK